MIPKHAQAAIDTWRNFGKKIGFINGCFDLLHAGHVNLIKEAYKHCDHLVAGVNCDQSVRELKGAGRPVQDEQTRAYALFDRMKMNEYVFIFDDDKQLLALIKDVRPHVLIKGDTYSRDEIVGADFVESNGGKIVYVPRVKGISTTTLLEDKNVKR